MISEIVIGALLGVAITGPLVAGIFILAGRAYRDDPRPATTWDIPRLTDYLLTTAETVVACVPPRNEPERDMLERLREATAAMREAVAGSQK